MHAAEGASRESFEVSRANNACVESNLVLVAIRLCLYLIPSDVCMIGNRECNNILSTNPEIRLAVVFDVISLHPLRFPWLPGRFISLVIN